MNLQEGHRSVPGPEGPSGCPAPPPAPLTCRVGSRVAKWESCSLKALSFSSYWLGEGPAASSGCPALLGASGPGHSIAPPALYTLFRPLPVPWIPCPPHHVDIWMFGSPGWGSTYPGPGCDPSTWRSVDRDGDPTATHLCTACSSSAFLSASLSWEGQSATDCAGPALPPAGTLPLPGP